jgi:hypothetical protein
MTAEDPAHRRAHRAVLDHVLALAAGAPWGDGLVLRGSAALSAWLGAAAREPADLDWVVLEGLGTPVDPLDPHPYLESLAPVRLWPEVAHDAGQYEIWDAEDLETGGLRARPAPEGLRWVRGEELHESAPPFGDLRERLLRHPEAAPGVRADVARAWEDDNWTYLGDASGIRLVVPWHVEGGPAGELRLDFALDDRMPEAPRWAAVPRADGQGPSVVRAAGPELCLAWKLLWLAVDARSGAGRVKSKDLYDAVVLAEHPRTRLTPRLLRTVMSRTGGPAGLCREEMLAWRAPVTDTAARTGAGGDASAWAARLVVALEAHGLL